MTARDEHAERPAPHPLLVELRRARKDRGLTQEGLAKMLGLSRTAVQAWELGRNQPRLAELRRWAEALDHDVVLDAESGERTPPPALEEVQAARRAVLLRETSIAEQLDDYAELWGQGLTNRQIAERMHVSVATAQKYRRRLAATRDYAPGGAA